MLAYVKGILMESSPIRAIIDVHGVGYEILIPLSTSSKLPQAGKETILYTTLVVREDSHTLYGFFDKAEKEFFHLLLNVNGIGPKTALNLIGHFSSDQLSHAIASNDTTLLSKIPGIGKKTAERLIVELKDKLPSLPGAYQVKLASPALNDAHSALLNLGFTSAQAQKALKKTVDTHGEKLDLAEIITLTLKHI